MYPFSISIHEHVPLYMGAGLGFFQGRASSGFSRGGSKIFLQGAKNGEVTFPPLETKKTTFFAKI